MRRRGGQGDRRAMLNEASDALILVEHGAMVDAPHVPAMHERLVELAGLLEMPAPPSLAALTFRGASDEWAIRAGLLHDGCRYESGQHWVSQCRG